VIVAGAGIAGLTAALALVRFGFRVTVLEQAERLEETGAGIQLSPNASRVLIELGLGERLQEHAVVPEALRVHDAATGRAIVRMPLGPEIERRHGAPYWSIHRGDLQAALAAAVAARGDISLKLGMRVEDFETHGKGVSVAARGRSGIWHEHGSALIAADGLWSLARGRLGFRDEPRFSSRVAFRAVVPARDVASDLREPMIHLWLGRNAHLVHYPVKAGDLVNIVAITADDWQAAGWSEPAGRAEVLPRFPAERWAAPARALLALPDSWLKWALYDRPALSRWSQGAVALIGDAAHPMLPYLAQGAAMAIEDSAVLADALARRPDDAAAAFRAYCFARRARTRRVQQLAARNGTLYHLPRLAGLARNMAMRAMGGTHLLRHHDWIYAWQPPPAAPTT